jgi:chemotaxis protein CheZ
MSQFSSPFALSAAEYAAIENAILQSGKGRGFLSDYLQRNRASETQLLLRAIARLQHVMEDMEGTRHLARIRRDLQELQRNMTRTRRELASIIIPDDAAPGTAAAAAEIRAIKLDAAFAHVEAEVMAILDMWEFDAVPDDAVSAEQELPPAVEAAVRNGLIEELSFAMLSDAQKAALFN